MKTLDAGQAETNKLIEKVEKRVNKEYSQATKDMQKKLNDYLKSFESKDKAMQKQLADGLITEKQYKDWRYGQIMVGKRWQEQLDVLSKDLENSRQIALNIVSGELPSAYAIGHNYGTYLVESGTSLNTSYTLYNRDTVSKLIKDRPKLLPDPTKGSKTQKALQEKRIQKWSKAKMTSAIAQGVLQGEAIPKIASRLRNVTDMSYRASIRNARTMLTSSENLGRQASFERAQDMGIEMEKQWLATLDDRTRDSHALMDGERVPLDENFSNGLEYPADPSGEPEEIYNCRCTLVTAIKGFEKALTDFDLSENEKLHGMSYDEWKESHLTNDTENGIIEETEEDTPTYAEELEIDEFPNDQAMEELLDSLTEDDMARIADNWDWDDYTAFENADDKAEVFRLLVEDAMFEAPKMEFDGVEYTGVPKKVFEVFGNTQNITDVEKEWCYRNGWEKGYIQTGYSFDINRAMRTDNFDSLADTGKKTVETLREVIKKNELPMDTRLVRFVDNGYLQNTFGLELSDLQMLARDDPEHLKTAFKGLRATEKQFMSSSTDVGANVFTERPVKLDILAPKGTNAYVTQNLYESEVIFADGITYEVQSMGLDWVKDQFGDETQVFNIVIKMVGYE